VLLDENVDSKLRPLFDSDFRVRTVRECGWAGKKNGDLLRAAEAEFDVLVTLERNMRHQQHLPRYALAVVLITAKSNRRRDIEPAMGAVNGAVHEARPGVLTVVAV